MKNRIENVAADSARGGFFLFSGSFTSTAIAAIASILVARLLGPEFYGQYTLALVFPVLLFLFTDLGINQGIIKFSAELKGKGETKRIARLIKYGLLCKAFAGLVIFVLNYSLADLLASFFLQRPEIAIYIRIASFSVIFQVIYSTAISAFVGLDKSEYNALATNIQAIAKSLISIVLVLSGFSVLGVVLGHVTSYVFAGISGGFLLLFLLRTTRDVKRDIVLKDDLKTLLRYGAPLYMSLLLMAFIPLYQNLNLALFTSDSDIGNFKAATNFAFLITVVTMPITTTLLPAFSKLGSSAKKEIEKFYKLSIKYTSILVLPVTILIIIFASQIVQIIYGSSYHLAPLFLASYCLLYFLVGMGYLTLESFYNGLGETRTTLIMSLITFIVIAFLSPVLTLSYGVLGLVAAFLVASLVGTLYGAYKARTRHKINFDVLMTIKIYLVSVVSIVPLLLFQFLGLPNLIHVIIGGCLYLFIYVTLTPIAKIVNNIELQKAMNVLGKTKLLTYIFVPLLKYQKKLLDILIPYSCKQEPLRDDPSKE